MSKLNGKSVTDATMHDSLFVNGIGEIKKELSSVSNGLSRGVKMTIDEPFLSLEIFSPKSNRTYQVAVPLTNFKRLVIDSAPVTTPPTKD
jgi:hypothetical protein